MPDVMFDSKLESERNTARWLYIFHGASFLFSLGMLSWIPLIINFIKRGDATGTFVYSHHTWQIRSFLWYLAWMLAGGVLFITIILIPLAWLVWTAAWVWKAYRLLKGFIDLNAGKPMPV